MGLFDRFKKKPKREAPGENASLIVALSALPDFDTPAIEKALGIIEPLRIDPKIRIDVSEPDDAGRVLAGQADFDHHAVRIVGFDIATPKPVIEKTIETSAWKGEAREQLLKHKAHLILFHEGGAADMTEQLVALYKLAAVIAGDNLAGVIFEQAWTCASADAVCDFADPGALKAMREALPPIVFFGILPFHEDGETWVATKGCHLFGVPDLVIEKKGEANSEIFDLLHNIFLYMAKGDAKIAAGHTMQFGDDKFLKFEALDDEHPYFDWLKGSGATLLLSRITKEDIAG